MNKSISTCKTDNVDCIIINAIPLMIKEYNKQRVVTFKDIDTVHNRPRGTARKRFNDNKKHFIEGEDFYKVKCEEVRPFFGQTLPNGFNPNSDIVLVTESGYLMLVKSFTDEIAWDVQRQLVKTYFKSREAAPLMYGLLETMQNLQAEINDIKVMLESKSSQPNYWLWKKHVVNSAIDNVALALNIDVRDAYDMVYDNMSSAFGFDRSFALNQFCTKYGVKTAPVIDAIADCPQYQIEFVQAVNNILGETMPQEPIVDQFPSGDKIQNIIAPLIKKLGDKSANEQKHTVRCIQ